MYKVVLSNERASQQLRVFVCPSVDVRVPGVVAAWLRSTRVALWEPGWSNAELNESTRGAAGLNDVHNTKLL